MDDYCFGMFCFVQLDPNGKSFFGFSEYLAALALMVLAWTIADVRYRFRVRTTSLPLQGLTFYVIAAVGVLALLTDLWRAEGWYVLKGNIITPEGWQALLGGCFLFTFLSWSWFAFIRPPKYGRKNAQRYAQTLYRFILKGSPSELSEISDELSSSAKSLVHFASNLDRYEREHNRDSESEPELVTGYADDILLLIADKRFCRVIVESSPGTALAFFREIGETEKYNVNIGIFAKNIVKEAISNKNSFLFHEAEGYESGLIGYHKPLSQAMFSNYQMVESVDTMLDAGMMIDRDWDAEQWGAYCRIVLMPFRDYVASGHGMHSFTLYRAKGYIEHAVDDLYKINGVEGSYNDDVWKRLRVVVHFIQDAVKILDEKGKPKYIKLRIHDRNDRETFYDYLANMIFEVIFAASAVRAPRMHCWMIQHNVVWSGLMNFHHLEGPAGKVIKFKLRRLIYNEILDMNRFPNFKGARILGFCLNVMGFEIRNDKYNLDSRALQKVILEWTKRHFAWLYSYNRQVAEACLVDGHEYDAENHRLVRVYPAEGLRREPSYVYLDVEPTPDSGDESPAPPRFLGI